MKDKKMVTCIITDQEIPKRKSKLVLDHRVCPEAEDVAKGLLIDAPGVFLEIWTKHNKSATDRKYSLIFAVTVLKACIEIVGCDATIFIVELARQAEAAGDPLNITFTLKLLDFIGGENIPELNDKRTQSVIDAGFKAFKKQWDNDK